MLSEIEKQELIQDSLDGSRREVFRKVKNQSEAGILSLDHYLKFLSQVQRIFSSLEIPFKKPNKTFLKAYRL